MRAEPFLLLLVIFNPMTYTEESHSVALTLIQPRLCPYSFAGDAFVENFQSAIHSIL